VRSGRFKDEIIQVNRDFRAHAEQKDFRGNAAMNSMNLYHLGGLLLQNCFEQRLGVDLDEMKDELALLVLSVRNEMMGGANSALLSVTRKSTNPGRNVQCDA
jgi:hypothetical protein